MYECPNCAANLRFDIARQQLYCMHCDTTVDPYHFQKERDAEEQVISVEEEDYEVTIFTCPQCGGEIVGEDTTAATFCSFCGGATILDSRISRERRPEIIIPFKKTKEDCKNAYAKMMRRAIFAPSELKDEMYIQKFRGIYMPYWVYDFEKKESVVFQGSQTHREGNYVITKYYDLSCDVEEEYRGIAYDASASFSDNLSAAIAPFDMKEEKPFTPSFLSGFYADTNDVDASIYWKDAMDMVTQDGIDRISRNSLRFLYAVESDENKEALADAVCPAKTSASLALLPVWFLSYRKDDRVMYAAVNGQTGKVVADLPIESKKYLLASVFLTIPIFILLNLFFTITPVKILVIATVLSLVSALLANRQLTYLIARESGEDDKGIQTTQAWKNRHAQETDSENQMKIRFSSEDKRTMWEFFKALPIAFMIVASNLIMGPGGNGSGRLVVKILIFGIVWFVAVNLMFSDSSMRRRRRTSAKKMDYKGNLWEKLPTLAKPLAGAMLATFILVLRPVYDWFYYIGACVCMCTIIWSFIDLIKHHNLLSTRELPQFNIRGGV